MNISQLFSIILFVASCKCYYFRSDSYTVDPVTKIAYYEFGQHVNGEEISFAHNGIIRAFTPIYYFNVLPTREDVEPRFTYLRVEFISPVSKVNITFDAPRSTLMFHIKFPFLDIPFGIIGYSMLNRNKVTDNSKMIKINEP